MEVQSKIEGFKTRTKTATQGVSIPLTFLPNHYAGKTVRVVIVNEDETMDSDDDDLFTPPNQAGE